MSLTTRGVSAVWGLLLVIFPQTLSPKRCPACPKCDRAGAAFLAAFFKHTEEDRCIKPRMISVANSLALAWATAVPGASTTRLSNEHFFVARRNTFGLRVLLQVEMQPCLFGADNARRPDHAMVCNGMQPNETEGNVMQQSLGSRLPLYKTRLMLSISKCKVDLNITYGLK